MNWILTHLQYNVNLHMYHTSDTGTNIIRSIVNSEKVIVRWREIELHYIINGDELWIPCGYTADTPKANLASIIQRTEWRTEP
jgi:hypothetical protein